jgi:phenylalanyl-tRNA synthetase beta chain
MRLANTEKAYRPLPKYPSTSRDIALLVAEEVQVGDLETIIRENGGSILEKLQLFDVYRGKQIGEGQKSLAFALTYRASDRTLTEEDVAKVHNKILTELKEKANAVLREI